MPRFDKKGPNGVGAMTGRKMGKCNSGNFSSNENSGIESDNNLLFGQRRGFGCKGRGNRNAGRGMGKGRM